MLSESTKKFNCFHSIKVNSKLVFTECVNSAYLAFILGRDLAFIFVEKYQLNFDENELQHWEYS